MTGRDNRKRAKTDTWRFAQKKILRIQWIRINKLGKKGSYLPKKSMTDSSE